MKSYEFRLEISKYDKILHHIGSNNIFVGHQSGFRKMHSCETALQLSLCKFRMELDNDRFVVVVLLTLNVPLRGLIGLYCWVNRQYTALREWFMIGFVKYLEVRLCNFLPFDKPVIYICNKVSK